MLQCHRPVGQSRTPILGDKTHNDAFSRTPMKVEASVGSGLPWTSPGNKRPVPGIAELEEMVFG